MPVPQMLARFAAPINVEIQQTLFVLAIYDVNAHRGYGFQFD